jgi:hypothetical protein
LCGGAGIAELRCSGIAEFRSKIEDPIVGAEDDLAGKGVVIAAAFDFSWEDSEHEIVAILGAGLEHFIGVESARVAVSVDGLFEVFFEKCFRLSHFAFEE